MNTEKSKLKSQQEQLDISVISGICIKNVDKLIGKIIFLYEELGRLDRLQESHPDDNRIGYWKENVRGQLKSFKYISENVK